MIISAPLVNSGEAVGFYWPADRRSEPADRGTPDLLGTPARVALVGIRGRCESRPLFRRTQRPTSPITRRTVLSSPSFGGQPGCGDFQPLGGPQGSNNPGDLTGSVYGSDRTGGAVSWLARNKADHGTLWATTSAGRVFVTHNADASDPADGRLAPDRQRDLADEIPELDLSGPRQREPCLGDLLGLQRSDAHHSWSRLRRARRRSGPWLGFVHEPQVERGTATFPTPTGNGDLPVNDIVRDDAKKKLYVATDFGVVRGNSDGKGDWRVTPDLPRFEITHLEIQPSARVPTCVGLEKKDCPTADLRGDTLAGHLEAGSRRAVTAAS